MAWLRRLGLHLAAALGAVGIFVAAAAVGAHAGRPDLGTLLGQARPPAVTAQGTATPGRGPRIAPERSVTGTVREALPDGLVVDTARGQELQVRPAPGALIRLNGKAAPLGTIQAGDRVVILGQVQARGRFVAHAITARGPR
jgi:hypothetical protein